MSTVVEGGSGAGATAAGCSLVVVAVDASAVDAPAMFVTDTSARSMISPATFFATTAILCAPGGTFMMSATFFSPPLSVSWSLLSRYTSKRGCGIVPIAELRSLAFAETHLVVIDCDPNGRARDLSALARLHQSQPQGVLGRAARVRVGILGGDHACDRAGLRPPPPPS